VSDPPVPALPPLFDAPACAAGLTAGNRLARCRDALQHADSLLEQGFHAGVDISALVHARADFMDQLLTVLWDHLALDVPGLALLAVGGYGRGELHPHSDIDLLILCEQAPDEILRARIETFLTLLWDLHLAVGHSVRTPAECVQIATRDLTVATNLMESRRLRGSAVLVDEVRAATGPRHIWPSAEFFTAKLSEQRERHRKFADTEYNLEPNVKSSPGGLRDLQVIDWIARRHFGVSALDALPGEHFLNEDEQQTLRAGRDFLWRVRYALHLLVGREEDRLLFDYQRELAVLWGFADNDRPAVEQFMQRYYRWVMTLGQLNDVLIQNFEQVILQADAPQTVEQVNARFVIRNGYINVSSEATFVQQPGALMEVFLLCARDERITGIAAPTIRLIWESLDLIDEAFRADPANQHCFMELLRSPHKLALQLRRMARYGVLGRYLPAFARVTGQMQHDLFHIYTVDAHTLEVIKNMRRFLYPDFEERFPIICRIARRLPKKELLYLAGLFHDIGKGRGGDHSELGAIEAQAFCERHGLSAGDTGLVVWLVRHHLVMSGVAQRKDISDPSVIQSFAGLCGDQLRLDYLFALTVADITGTNPTLWNAWRSSLLRQLYTETMRALRRGLENPVDRQDWVANNQQAALRILEERGFTADEVAPLWEMGSEDYFLREKPEDVAWHTEAIARHYQREEPLVLIKSAGSAITEDATQIFIHARSSRHLFSVVTATLEQLDLSVHDARIYKLVDGMSLETFFVLDSNGQSIAGDAPRIRHIADCLQRTLALGGSATIVRRRTSRQIKSLAMPTTTSLTQDPIKQVSVLEVTSPDRPGLLARIGQVFSSEAIELQAAKIQTLGERVEDVFFITGPDHRPITDPERGERLQQAVRDALDRWDGTEHL